MRGTWDARLEKGFIRIEAAGACHQALFLMGYSPPASKMHLNSGSHGPQVAKLSLDFLKKVYGK
jgi:hypothetical protein